MFAEGDILYFSPFYFKNGNTPKNKYLVVLKNIGSVSIFAILPTSKDSIPNNLTNDKSYGCIECKDINFNCFVFTPKIEVTECGKRFEFQTHLYGYQIDDYNIDDMIKRYPIVGKDFYIWGKMKPRLFSELKDCFRNSASVKRKYKKIL